MVEEIDDDGIETRKDVRITFYVYYFRIHVIIPSNQVRRTSPSLLMQKLDSYARKVEKDVFETATSKVC